MKATHLTFTWLVVALLGFGVVGAVVSSYLPTAQSGVDAPVADTLTLAALYSGLFLFLLGFGVLGGYGWRWRRDHTLYPANHWPVLRQASLTSLGATVLLALQGFKVLTWWDGALLIVALILIELSFQVRPTATS